MGAPFYRMRVLEMQQTTIRPKTRKGVQQGDPLSPILFNIVVDMLAILISRAKEAEHIRGVVPHLVDE